MQLSADGNEVRNYVAGMPFPHIDARDPQAAQKIMWNIRDDWFTVAAMVAAAK